MKANFEGDINMKNQFRIKNSPDPISIREAASKNYVVNKFNDHNVLENIDLFDLNDKSLNNVQFIKVNSLATLEEQPTPKFLYRSSYI